MVKTWKKVTLGSCLITNVCTGLCELSFIGPQSVALFMLQQQSCVVATEIVESANPKILYYLALYKKQTLALTNTVNMWPELKEV